MNIYSVGVGVPEEVGRIRTDLISSKSKLFMNLKKKEWMSFCKGYQVSYVQQDN